MKNSFLLPLLCWLAGLGVAGASEHNGSIQGQITEQGSGLELAGATVRLDPGGLYTHSNALGFFSFSNLPAGTYTLAIQFIGYENKILEQVQVRDAETSIVRIDLSPAPLNLQDVEVKTATSQPFQTISALDIRTRPITSTQDVLRTVPGLFIAQHAGGGKAEQIFLRGFDIDHGTDINLTVDGLPVNMVSHAHGQGYADLHFVIPEIIDQVEFKKGPYDASAGDFTTAGLVRFKTADVLDRSFFKVEGGQFATARAVGAFNLLGKNAERRNRSAYIASETSYSDGYFDSPQAFSRFNLFGKYRALMDDDQRVTISASAFQSTWDASGQIPERAVANGTIGRFGAIDNTEGGTTHRYNFNFEHAKSLSGNRLVKNQLFYSDYGFELFSNFTFFKEDPVRGDQIRQKERRRIFGYNGSYQVQGNFLNKTLESEIGLFFRNDRTSDSELSRSVQRTFTASRLALGDVNQTNTGAWISETWRLSPDFTINAGLRADIFQFAYEDKLDSIYAPGRETAMVASPKLNLYFDPSSRLRLYLSGGYGFHSNDARVVIPQRAQQILPQALGADLGAVFKPTPSLFFNVAAWYLALEQEFVYVGDEAVVEPGGKTLRLGADVSARWQVFRHLFIDADVTYSRARATEEPEGAQFIPLAPQWTAAGGLVWDRRVGFFGSLRFRQLGDRPANGDNSLNAEGYFLLDAVAGWKQGAWEFGLNAQNLLNEAWKEAQFETESQLRGETMPVTEIHYTPGTPFFARAYVTFRF
jgi:hypothetical protein